jgi:SUKH-3 immunity protein of toxin-antitoxin system
VALGYRPSFRETDEWSRALGSMLIAVGSCHDGYGEVLVDELGRCFEFTGADCGLHFLGRSIEDGLLSLLLGRRGRPLLKPGCEVVAAYGVKYERGDPEIYEPK